VTHVDRRRPPDAPRCADEVAEAIDGADGGLLEGRHEVAAAAAAVPGAAPAAGAPAAPGVAPAAAPGADAKGGKDAKEAKKGDAKK
jgi:hypothetical protein